MRRVYYLILGIILMTISLQSLQGQSKVSLVQIKKNLICTCDCAMTVDACEGSMACEEAAKLAAEVSRLIEAGLEQKVILASFSSRYGEKILAAPTKEGFNLLAWIMPFAVTLISGYGITRILQRWTSAPRNSKSGSSQSTTPSGQHSAYADRLDEILRKLD